MPKDLSVIIPCFNASRTLEEAVSSCFRQDIEHLEIVLVDDGSSDGTKDLIQRLAETHPEIRAAFHAKNLGGGAARNTGARAATSEVLFLLDSDDLLPDGTLRKMLDLLREKRADGVGIERSIKFKGTDTSDVEVVHTFERAGERIALDDLLQRDGLCALYSTFMLTKDSFERAGGYPIDHGFDTQAFAWRFLSSGGVAYVCPGASYLHRVNFSRSYYLREADAGRVNFNWLDILDEHFYLLPTPMQTRLLHFHYRSLAENVFDAVRSEPGSLLSRDKAAYTATLSGKEPGELTQNEEYWLGSEHLRSGGHALAQELLLLANRHRPSAVVREKLLAAELAGSGMPADAIRARISDHRRPVRKDSLSGIVYRVRHRLRAFLATQEAMKDSLLSAYHFYEDMASRLDARHSPSLMLNLCRLTVQKIVGYGFPMTCDSGTREEVDVVIPTLPKDREMLVAYLATLKKNLCERIGTIFVVAPKDEGLEAFCTEKGIVFVDERTVLGYGKEAINYSVNGQNRGGWLFQQLLKLGSEAFVRSSRYIIVDSDTLLVRPHQFLIGGRTVFLENSEWQEPYFRSFERLFGYEAPNRCSLTSHMMLFTTERLREMKREIETRHGTRWDAAYIDAAEKTKSSGISDYDTYANWLLHTHPDEAVTRPFYNKSFSRKRLGELDSLIRRHSGRHASFSFHSYNG